MLVTADNPAATPIVLVSADGLQAWREGQSALAQAWLARGGFEAKPGQFAWLPNAAGEPALVAVGCGAKPALGTLGRLAFRLAEGDYRLEGELSPAERHQVLLGWGLGAYRFAGYKDQPGREPARLLTRTADAAARDECAAVALCRDLINTPANDMLPHHLEAAARELAAAHGADVEVTVGEALLERGMRTIHAVGRASAAAPRLIDLRWGSAEHPQVVLVGKGVCFDSGGLDLKTAAGMRLMKKDMGGAAHALGLAKLIMAHGLPVALRVLVPAVENAVAGNAFRPGDVLRAYDGTTIEIDNTDAEGRLILCDALALAAEASPDVIIDFATLTGAARVALGTALPAMFATDDAIAQRIAAAGEAREDPVWRMPLHTPYRELLKSDIADIANAPSSGLGGAITAALFLQRFVGATPWVHFDVMAWNERAGAARPKGGEAMGLRAVHAFLAERYAMADG